MGCLRLAAILGVVALAAACAGSPEAADGGKRSIPSPMASSSTSATPTVPVLVPGPGGAMPVLEHGGRGAPIVALTFDGDMTEGMLRKLDNGTAASYDGAPVLDELERMRVPATFFITGLWAKRYPDSARRIARNTLFEAGSHSYSHRAFAQPCYTLEPLPTNEMRADITHSYELIRQYVPNVTPYFRFPGGCHDDVALTELGPLKLVAVQWDVISGDAFGTSVDAIVRQSLAKAQNGSIIVLHSTLGTAPLTPKALPRIVDGLRAKGLRPVRLSELLSTSPLSRPTS